MATIGYTEIAERYATLTAGPRLTFSFETQTSQPVDGSNPMLRDLSPFTLFLLPPAGETVAADHVHQYAVTIDNEEGDDATTASADFNDFNTSAYVMSDSHLHQESANTIRANFGLDLVEPSTVSSMDMTIAQLQQAVAYGKELKTTGQGEQVVPTLCDEYTVADILLQVAQLLAVPPLTMLINPKEMVTTYNQIQSFTDRGRDGFIFQRWGEQQPTISFQGSTGAFMAAEPTSAGAGADNASRAWDQFVRATDATSVIGAEDGYTENATGVQFASMRDSAAFQNFVALYQFYRNNGLIHDTIQGSEAHLFVGAVAIHYDQWIYVGHMTSFEVSFTDEKQHSMDFNIEFTVDQMFDTATSPAVVLPMTAPSQATDYPGRSSTSTSNPTSSADLVLSTNGVEWLAITGGNESFVDNSTYNSTAWSPDGGITNTPGEGLYDVSGAEALPNTEWPETGEAAVDDAANAATQAWLDSLREI